MTTLQGIDRYWKEVLHVKECYKRLSTSLRYIRGHDGGKKEKRAPGFVPKFKKFYI